MPSIFKRISDVITTNIHDLIDRVEDPQRMIRQMVREIEDNIAQAQEGVIDACASEKRLQEDLNGHTRHSQEWLRRAGEAIQAGRRDLARTAVEHKKEHDNVVKALKPSWEAAQITAERLKSQLSALQAKLREAKRTQAVWAARQRAAEVQQTMERTLAKVKSLSDSASVLSIQATFSQAVDKIKFMEAKAKALAEMFNTYSEPEEDSLKIEMARTIESELAEIEIKVQRELLTQQEQPLIPKLQEAPSGKHSHEENS